MTISASDAKARTIKNKQREGRFDYRYPYITKLIDEQIEIAIENSFFDCKFHIGIDLGKREISFFQDLKAYYEGLGYQIDISEFIYGETTVVVSWE